MVSDVATKRFTIDEYRRMVEAGAFAPDDRLELLEGEIIQMNPIGLRHAATVNRLTRLFFRVLGERVLISVQNPVDLPPRSEPQPDLLVLRTREDDYEEAMPIGADTHLVVEVADTTFRYDTTRKVPAYARGGVSAVWVVALGTTRARDRVLVFEDPVEGVYTSRRELHRGETLAIPGFSDVSIAVSDFL